MGWEGEPDWHQWSRVGVCGDGRGEEHSPQEREKPKPTYRPVTPRWWDLPCKISGRPSFDRVVTDGTTIIVYMKESMRGKHMETLDAMTSRESVRDTAVEIRIKMAYNKVLVKYV